MGNFGQTFEIVEQDLLEMITQKLQKMALDNKLLDHQVTIQKRMLDGVQNPYPIKQITRTQNPRVFTFDPSIKAPFDLKDHRGKVFIKAGTLINPLDTHAFSKIFIFIDAKDKEQLSWALKNFKESHKVILINGSPIQLMEDYQIPFYFDQGGTLTQKFRIKQVPARVSQWGKVLKIEEILLNGNVP